MCSLFTCLSVRTHVFPCVDVSAGCLLQSVPSNPTMFAVNTGMFRREFPCPENTLFDQNQCGCGWVENPINKCKYHSNKAQLFFKYFMNEYKCVSTL